MCMSDAAAHTSKDTTKSQTDKLTMQSSRSILSGSKTPPRALGKSRICCKVVITDNVITSLSQKLVSWEQNLFYLEEKLRSCVTCNLVSLGALLVSSGQE